jgi:hypothetical protein
MTKNQQNQQFLNIPLNMKVGMVCIKTINTVNSDTASDFFHIKIYLGPFSDFLIELSFRAIRAIRTIQ